MKEFFILFLDRSIEAALLFYRFSRKSFLLIALGIFALILFSNLVVLFFAQDKIYYNSEFVPEKKVALVLGTSKYVAGDVGLVNLFYKKRLEAANELFDSGNIEYLILSGTNDSQYYNEPETMKNDLMEMGVPENKIFLDYAGFRTLDSILRAREIFSQTDIVIVSQKFHLQRALLIAGVHDIHAVGYAAKDPPFWLAFPTYSREVLSRVKLFFDIAVEKQATVYGEKVIIQ